MSPEKMPQAYPQITKLHEIGPREMVMCGPANDAK